MMKSRADYNQKEKLFKLMEAHFYNGADDYDSIQKKEIWNDITVILNNIGPPRTCSKWRKFWTDTLLRVRRKIACRNEIERKEGMNKRNLRMKKICFTKEDLEVLRITGGEQKLITEFRPRSNKLYYKIACKEKRKTPVYYIDDSTAGSSEFEVTNQPVSEDFYEMDTQNQSKDSFNYSNSNTEYDDDANDNDAIDSKDLSQQQLSMKGPEQKISMNPNRNNSMNCSVKLRKLNYFPPSIDTNSNSSSNLIDNHYNLECVTNFDVADESENLNSESSNRKKQKLNPVNTNESEIMTSDIVSSTPVIGNGLASPESINLSPSFVTINEESLKVQKETLNEIRKMNEVQQETNQLLKTLIEKLMNDKSNNNNTNNNNNNTNNTNDEEATRNRNAVENESLLSADLIDAIPEFLIKKEK